MKTYIGIHILFFDKMFCKPTGILFLKLNYIKLEKIHLQLQQFLLVYCRLRDNNIMLDKANKICMLLIKKSHLNSFILKMKII